MIGTPDEWDTTISVSGSHGYGFCTWSPCCQFVAAQTGQRVEIRNPLTFELLTILQSPKYTPLPTSPLAYSPDGRSLACGYSGGIVIWDIQTGGVANEIRRNKDITSLVWSLDGSMVAITFRGGRFITEVETFNILSGAKLFSEQFEVGASVYLWAHEKSFRLIKAVPKNTSITCTITEIGPTLIEIESSGLGMTDNLFSQMISEIAFSPFTYHIAILGSGFLLVYDIRTSHCLLNVDYDPYSLQFSPDGSHFAYSHINRLRVFQCTPYGYILLWESPFNRVFESSFQFSPTSSSILTQDHGILQVQRLNYLPIASENSHQYTRISRSGRRIATVRQFGTTISIVDIHSRSPSQFIDTGFEVWNLYIAGNVLVARGSEEVMGWLLAEEGTVDGVFDDQRASGSDSKWSLHLPHNEAWGHSVEGVVGVIWAGHPSQPLLRYHIETGDLSPKPQSSRSTSLESQSYRSASVESQSPGSVSLESQSSRSASPQPLTRGRLRHHLHCPLHILQCSPHR